MTNPCGKRRVTMECPTHIEAIAKVLVDGERIPATPAGIRKLKDALADDAWRGFEPPSEVADLLWQ